MLWSRIATGVIGAGVLLWLVNVGSWPLKVAVICLTGLGLSELHQIVRRANLSLDLLLTGALTILFIGFPELVGARSQLILAAAMLYLLARSVVDHRRFSLVSMALTAFAALYIPFLFSRVIIIRQLPDGVAWLAISFAITWGYDTAAFVAGSTWGRRKLCPELSPGKSVEGVLGGVVISTVAPAVVGLAFGLDPLLVGLIGLLGGAVAQIGDLAESAIKRQFGTKDAGHILPGHGGILDRFDSYLAVIAYLYVLLTVGQ